jgi:2-dehydro-3-deoxygalactonokinase
MTGELFEVLAYHSILSLSVSNNSWNQQRESSFIRGVELGFSKRLAASIFAVRVQDLLYNVGKEDNYYFLSGIIIGDELANMKGNPGKTLIAGTSPLIHLYEIAARTSLAIDLIEIIDGQQLELCFLKGQRNIMQYVSE